MNTTSGESLALAAAVDEIAAAVTELRRASGDAELLALGVVKLRPDAAELAGFAGEALPRVYREFLQGHSSHDFVDAGLQLGARPVWISAASSVRELTAMYRVQTPGWRANWVVCGLAGDGCYVLDLFTKAGADCPVLYVANEGAALAIAPGFVAFLQAVARDSRPMQPGLRDRSPIVPPPARQVLARQRAAAEARAVDEVARAQRGRTLLWFAALIVGLMLVRWML